MNERTERRRGSGAPTIYDIAEVAGVNPSTVSRALGKPGRVAPATAKRVQEAAQALNYRANPMAKALLTGRTNTVGLIVADLTNPVFFEIVRGAQAAAAAGNYTLLLAESAEDPEQEMVAASRMASAVDGLVLATSRLVDCQIQELAQRRPAVVINRVVDGVASVAPDATAGIREAMAMLASHGHRSVSYAAGPERSWVNRRRRELIREVADIHSMEVVCLESAAPTRESGRAAVSEILRNGSTAVFAYNDLMAIGMLQECAARGIEVPQRLSIVGFDDIFGAELTSPALSTVRFPLYSCGSAALAMLVRRIENSITSEVAPAFGSEFVQRGSIGAARLPVPVFDHAAERRVQGNKWQSIASASGRS